MFSILKTNLIASPFLKSVSSSSLLPQFKPEKLNFFQHFFLYSVFLAPSAFKLYYLSIIKVLFILLLKLTRISNFS